MEDLHKVINVSGLLFAVICIFLLSILDGKKSGLYYLVHRMRRLPNTITIDARLERYYKNIHALQTLIWPAMFYGFGMLVFLFAWALRPQDLIHAILACVLITAGSSSASGPFRQGNINVGSGFPYDHKKENPKMEFINPFTGKSYWISRFWHGKNRVYAAIAGVIGIIAGFLIIFTLPSFKTLFP